MLPNIGCNARGDLTPAIGMNIRELLRRSLDDARVERKGGGGGGGCGGGGGGGGGEEGGGGGGGVNYI